MMSGTSTDGIGYLIFEINKDLKLKVIKYGTEPYEKEMKDLLLSLAEKTTISKYKLAKANINIGKSLTKVGNEYFGEYDIIVFSGHTLYHNPNKRLTFQIGDTSGLSYSTGVPVINDLRYSDLAIGKEGAPLVQYADTIIYGDNKVVINIGGISNITITGNHPTGFDTGPGNMLMDLLTRKYFNSDYDRDGKIGSKGKVNDNLVNFIMKDHFITKKPPKSTGRERYGLKYFNEILKVSKEYNINPEDIMATLSYYTAYSLYYNIKSFVPGYEGKDIICAGGGCMNKSVIDKLQLLLGKRIISSDELGIPVSAREPLAFGIIAYFSLLKSLGILKEIPTRKPYGKISVNGLFKIL